MTWAYIASSAAENGSVSDVNAQFGATVPVDALMIACARSSTGTPTKFTNATTGDFTSYVYPTDTPPDSDGNWFTVGWLINPTEGTHNITLSGSSLGNIYISVAAYTGGAGLTVTELEKSVRDADDNDATANSDAVTVPAADAIAIGLGICGSGTRTFSAGGTGNGTWVQRSTGSAWRACIQDILNVGTGSAESAPNISGGNSPNQGAIFILGELTAGASIVPQAMYHYRNNTGSGL